MSTKEVAEIPDAILKDMETVNRMKVTMTREQIKETPEFRRLAESACGIFAHLGYSVDDFLREKREEVERENR